MIMKNIIFILIVLMAATSCRSVRRTTVDIDHRQDSSSYTKVTTVDLDTTKIEADTATLEAILDISQEGSVTIEQITQEQGDDITIDYTVEKLPAGNTKVTVTAKTKPKEIITQNVTTEIIKAEKSSEVQQLISEKKVKGISPWNLAWLIPVALIGIVIYVKRKTILKFLPF